MSVVKLPVDEFDYLPVPPIIDVLRGLVGSAPISIGGFSMSQKRHDTMRFELTDRMALPRIGEEIDMSDLRSFIGVPIKINPLLPDDAVVILDQCGRVVKVLRFENAPTKTSDDE